MIYTFYITSRCIMHVRSISTQTKTFTLCIYILEPRIYNSSHKTHKQTLPWQINRNTNYQGKYSISWSIYFLRVATDSIWSGSENHLSIHFSWSWRQALSAIWSQVGIAREGNVIQNSCCTGYSGVCQKIPFEYFFIYLWFIVNSWEYG